MKIYCHVHTEKFYKGQCLDQLMESYIQHEITAFVSTDHFRLHRFLRGRITLDDWWIPYYAAVEVAAKHSIYVLPGAEVTIGGNDYLVYVLKPHDFELLLEQMKFMEFINTVNMRGGLVVQAHPLRQKEEHLCMPSI